MEKIFFYLTIILWPFTFCGCSFFSESTMEFVLPQWPPSDSSEYPQLSRWCIEYSGTENQKFYVDKDQKSFTVKKDKALISSITAIPITFDSDGNEVSFFKPCGIVINGRKNNLTWETGFSAKVCGLCINGSLNRNLALDFISRFNWERFDSIINQKIQHGIESFENQSQGSFYNPWQLNLSEIAAYICNGKFSAACLNIPLSKIINSKLETTGSFQKDLLSSFIVENQICREYGSFCLNKDVINLFSMYNKTGVVIKFTNSENIWAEIIKLPIYYIE